MQKLQRLTAQSLKFRVTLSSLGAEELPSHAREAYLSWVRGKKAISTSHSLVQECKAEWQDDLSQVVTMYFQVGKGKLQPTSKEYSVKIKHGQTGKTLGKVKIDISKHCGLESAFKRTFLELSTKTGIKVFLVISTELVDEEQGEEGSMDEPNSATRRTLSDTYIPTTSKDFDLQPHEDEEGVLDNHSKSLQDLSSRYAESPQDPSQLIQQSIDILHSSSSEEEEEPPGLWQAIARRMTPKATPSSKPAVNRRHTIATETAAADTQISKNLFFAHEPIVESTPVRASQQTLVNPFGSVPEEMDDSNDGSPCTTSSAESDQHRDAAIREEMLLISKLRTEKELLRTQCSQLQAENALLKDRIQGDNIEKESFGELKERCSRLEAENTSLRRRLDNQEASKKDEEESIASNSKRPSPLSPVGDDMISELIETKMKLALAQSTIDEMKPGTSSDSFKDL